MLIPMAMDKCEHCGSDKLVEDFSTGEFICTNCGLVIDVTPLSRSSETKIYDGIETGTRTGLGLKPSVSDKGLSTTFLTHIDGKGNPLNSVDQSKMFRLRRYNVKEDMSSRNLRSAFGEIDRLCQKLNIPSYIKENACMLYRKVLRAKLVRGRSIDSFAVACLYAACRYSNVPKLLRQFKGINERSYKDMTRTYRFMVKELNLKVPREGIENYVSMIVSKLGLSPEIDKFAMELVNYSANSGRDPAGVAAAAVYVVTRERYMGIRQTDVASAANVTEVTIRNRSKSLIEERTKVLAKVK